MIIVCRAETRKDSVLASLLAKDTAFSCFYREDALQRLEVKRRGADTADYNHKEKVRTIDLERSGKEMAQFPKRDEETQHCGK